MFTPIDASFAACPSSMGIVATILPRPAHMKVTASAMRRTTGASSTPNERRDELEPPGMSRYPCDRNHLQTVYRLEPADNDDTGAEGRDAKTVAASWNGRMGRF